MDKPQKSQIAKISLIALLFLITPLLSSSMRPPYLYFLLNLLIIALGAEAGLLSFFTPSDQENNKKLAFVAPKPVINVVVTPPVKEAHDHTDHDAVITTKNNNVESSSQLGTTDQKKVIMKSISEKIVTFTAVKVQRCPSMPSLFFIGGGEGDAGESEEEDDWVEEEEEMEGSLSGQELFTKAESFIGNFYKQLKMQREESWKRIHGFYHKAF